MPAYATTTTAAGTALEYTDSTIHCTLFEQQSPGQNNDHINIYLISFYCLSCLDYYAKHDVGCALHVDAQYAHASYESLLVIVGAFSG